MRTNDRIRRVRMAPVLGRPVPGPLGREEVLDDALLGSVWRWDADDDRSSAAR